MSSQADALLSSMTGSDAELGSAELGTMVLGMSAYDSGDVEEHIIVQPNRYIVVPEALKRIAVQYDNDVETVTFDCPRYWDEHDLSEMKIYINYLRADNKPGCYPVDNGVTVDEDDEAIIHFDWTIRRDVTEVDGKIVFLVCAKDVDEDGNEAEHWNSELCTDLYVSEGLETQETVVKRYPDLITHLLVRMDVVEEKTTLQAMLGYLDEYFATDATINDVLMHYVEDYLKTDDDVAKIIADTINAYIQEHLEVTDPTLTIEGGIADAAATGEAIKKINEDLAGYIKNSDVSTVSKDYVDIGVDDYTEVSASVCMVKLSKNIASITINYQITANTLATDVYKFIDMDKLKAALGLSYLGFHFGATAVILQPAISYSDSSLTENTSYATEEQRGYTGLMFSEIGGFCRIYEMGKAAGVWPLQCAMYKPGTYGTIIINGATIA